MRTVAIAELKAKLSRYLKTVKHGDEVTVTDRGQPVAKLVPVNTGGATPAEWAEMIKSGLVTPGKGPVPPHLRRPVIKAKDVKGSVVQALIDERDEHR